MGRVRIGSGGVDMHIDMRESCIRSTGESVKTLYCMEILYRGAVFFWLSSCR
jgi:hypothetical protein